MIPDLQVCTGKHSHENVRQKSLQLSNCTGTELGTQLCFEQKLGTSGCPAQRSTEVVFLPAHQQGERFL